MLSPPVNGSTSSALWSMATAITVKPVGAQLVVERLPARQVVAAAAPAREGDEEALATRPLVQRAGHAVEVRKREGRGVEVGQGPPAELGGKGHGDDAGVQVDHRRLADRGGHGRDVEEVADPERVHVVHRDAHLTPAEPARLELPTQRVLEHGRVDEEGAASGIGFGVHEDDVVGDDGDLTHCVLPGSSRPRGGRDAERPQSSASRCRWAPQVPSRSGSAESGRPGELPAPGPVAPAAVRGRRPRREQHHPALGRAFRGQRPPPPPGRGPRGRRRPRSRRSAAARRSGPDPGGARRSGRAGGVRRGPPPADRGPPPGRRHPRSRSAGGPANVSMDATEAKGLEARASSTKVRPSRTPIVRHRLGSPSNPATTAATASADGAAPRSSRAPATAPHRFQTLCRPGSRRGPVSASRVPSTSTQPCGSTWTRPAGPVEGAVRVVGRAAHRLGTAGADGQEPGGPGLDESQLVPVVGLDAAVPVEVVGGQAGQHHHPGGPGDVGRLVGGDLDHVGVGPGPAVGVEHRARRCCRSAPPRARRPRGWLRPGPPSCSCPWCR